MNCTVCRKPHSKEQPLTIAHNGEWLCPGCLKKLDKPENGPISGYSGTVKVGEVRLPTGFVRSDRIFSAAEIRTAIITTNATVKIGNLELPIERFEMK